MSPLRYPGGKERLAPFLAEAVRKARPRVRTYVEPFAGGCGAALSLLHDELIDSIIINDLNPGIAAFWRSVVRDSSALIDAVRSCRPTVDEWHRQRFIYQAPDVSDLERGFATFFLNRTNRSGIIDARPIGGLNQDGPWKIDARFNAEQLASRIRLISSYRSRIQVQELDARTLIKQVAEEQVQHFLYVDPPYIAQGGDLYMNALTWADHVELAEILDGLSMPWVLTYDCDDRVVRKLYTKRRCGIYELSHTATAQRFGEEYFVVSDDVAVDNLAGFGPRSASWL